MNRIAQITEKVAAKFEVSKRAIDEGERKVSQERYVAIYVAMKSGFDSATIARYFEQSDQTIRNATANVEKRIQDDVLFRVQINDLLKQLRGASETNVRHVDGNTYQNEKVEESGVDQAVDEELAKLGEEIEKDMADASDVRTSATTKAEDVPIDRTVGSSYSEPEPGPQAYIESHPEGIISGCEHHWLRQAGVEPREERWSFKCRDCAMEAWFPIPPFPADQLTKIADEIAEATREEGNPEQWVGFNRSDVEKLMADERRRRLGIPKVIVAAPDVQLSKKTVESLAEDVAAAQRYHGDLQDYKDEPIVDYGSHSEKRIRPHLACLSAPKGQELLDRARLSARLINAWRALRGRDPIDPPWAAAAWLIGRREQPHVTLDGDGMITIRVEGAGTLAFRPVSGINMIDFREDVTRRVGRIVQAVSEEKYLVEVE